MNASNIDITNKLSKPQSDVLLTLRQGAYRNQRAIAAETGLSLGMVNLCLRSLKADGYLDKNKQLTQLAESAFEAARPRRAVILAAGSGLRMAPLNELPKGLLEVRGERLIDRLIRQLHEAGVEDIRIVTGFMKEKYEYLSDLPGIKLVYNPDYVRKNNLHSLLLAADYLENTYILPSDVWFEKNPFSQNELYPWYLLTDRRVDESEAIINRKQELVSCGDDEAGFEMMSTAYLCGGAGQAVAGLLAQRAKKKRYQLEFWETVLLHPPCHAVYGRVVSPSSVTEISTFEDLRSVDYSSDQLSSSALDVIHEVLHTPVEGISSVEIMKKGMTNRSFLFAVGKERYIMRIPGEGSDMLINRAHEYAVYQAIASTGLGDQVLYISPDTGYKITKYWEHSRVCDPFSPADVAACMEKLRELHALKLQVPHDFDLFEQIEYYESLRHGAPSVFDDYDQVKAHVLGLRAYIQAQPREYCLAHIDANSDNCLFIEGGLRLIDWEYAGMQDPHLDVAMFGIYAMYDREHMEALIDHYFIDGCPPAVRIKIYCYIAVAGFLWSNWCEYKRAMGVEFGEYALSQYRYAKQYAAIAEQGMRK